MVIGDLKFFATVEVSDMNLLKAASASGDISDPSIEDSGNTRELIDNLIGKLMGDAAIVFDSTDYSASRPVPYFGKHQRGAIPR